MSSTENFSAFEYVCFFGILCCAAYLGVHAVVALMYALDWGYNNWLVNHGVNTIGSQLGQSISSILLELFILQVYSRRIHFTRREPLES